ncbi:hypothetical protein Tco_0607998 [Tanacetum coccineum]
MYISKKEGINIRLSATGKKIIHLEHLNRTDDVERRNRHSMLMAARTMASQLLKLHYHLAESSCNRHASLPQVQSIRLMTTLTPCPQDKMFVPTSKEERFVTTRVRLLFSPLLKDITIQHNNVSAEENNNDQAPNASFHQDDFFNPFCTRVQEIGESSVQEIGESSSRNIDNTDVHSFQPQSHDYR